ncbi:hypothetical protein BC629DRAFT_1525510 [Irpex lacteus]|nr:hypothetical protein BC629DRAFT_1525510 [Irpex lacteus]
MTLTGLCLKDIPGVMLLAFQPPQKHGHENFGGVTTVTFPELRTRTRAGCTYFLMTINAHVMLVTAQVNACKPLVTSATIDAVTASLPSEPSGLEEQNVSRSRSWPQKDHWLDCVGPVLPASHGNGIIGSVSSINFPLRRFFYFRLLTTYVRTSIQTFLAAKHKLIYSVESLEISMTSYDEPSR